jgi:hypothetical protein
MISSFLQLWLLLLLFLFLIDFCSFSDFPISLPFSDSFFLGLLFGLGHIYCAQAGKVLHTGSDTFVTWRTPTTRIGGRTPSVGYQTLAPGRRQYFLQRRPDQQIERQPFTTLVVEYTQLSYTGDSDLRQHQGRIGNKISGS